MTAANLFATFETPYNPAAAGLTVEAWPASDFTHSPVGNPGAYPPAPSPTATTTTDSSGNCELTGLTAGTDYYVSIIDQNNQPWFLFCPAAYLGNLSTSRRRWSINQGPLAAAATYNSFVAQLYSGIVGDGTVSSRVQPTVLPIAPRIGGGVWYYVGAAVQPPLLTEAKDAVFVSGLGIGSLLLPSFVRTQGTWTVNWSLYLTNADGSEQLSIDNDIGAISPPSSELTLLPEFSTGSTAVYQIGSDLVVPSTPGAAIKTTAGGYYQGFLAVDLQGGQFS